MHLCYALRVKILTLSKQPDLPETHLLTGLKERGVEIICACDPSSIAFGTLERRGLAPIALELRSRIDFAACWKIRNLLRTARPHIVHSFTNRALSNALFASIGVRSKHVAYRGTAGHLSRLDPGSWLTYLNPRVDKIVCVSDAVKRYLLGLGLAEGKLVRIYKGHDPKWYESLAHVERASIGIPSNAFVVSLTANMRRVKGSDILLDAFEQLQDLPDLHLLLIGEVRDERVARAIEQLKCTGRVHVLGYRADAPALVKISQVLVMPSREREGFPKAVLEAMIQGVPAVVSAVGGMPEIVINGENGLVVPPSDPAALAGALRSLYLDRPRLASMALAARARILQHFPIQNTVDQTIKLYQELLDLA